MAVEAPVSKYHRNNQLLYTVACAVVALILAYDGYLSKYEWSQRYSFYEKHVIENDNKPDDVMKFNRYAPIALIFGAAFFGYRYYTLKGRKIVVDETAVHMPEGDIGIDSIQAIDKTHYESKGYFELIRKTGKDSNERVKLSSKSYDNLDAVLEDLASRIS